MCICIMFLSLFALLLIAFIRPPVVHPLLWEVSMELLIFTVVSYSLLFARLYIDWACRFFQQYEYLRNKLRQQSAIRRIMYLS